MHRVPIYKIEISQSAIIFAQFFYQVDVIRMVLYGL